MNADEEEPEESLESGSLTRNEAVDELFDTTFNSIRDTIGNVTKKISDLIGEPIDPFPTCNNYLLNDAFVSIKGQQII